MITAWTKHLKDEKSKEAFKGSVIGSRQVLERLSEILDETEKDLNDTETSAKSYDAPNWDYKQADKNGYRRALRAVKKIINLDQKEIN